VGRVNRSPDDLEAWLQELDRTVERLAKQTGAPSMSTAQRDRLPIARLEGSIIYNTTTRKHEGCNGTAWFALY
jgi:hypothetical protein